MPATAEVVAWRDEIVPLLMKHGHSQEEAIQIASIHWQQSNEKQRRKIIHELETRKVKEPPKEEAAGQTAEPNVEELAHRLEDGTAPLDAVQEILWAYRNIENPKVRSAKHAPSVGAWGLLDWARRDKKGFYINLYSKAIVLAKDDETEVLKKYDRQMEEIREIIAKFRAA